MIDITDPDWNKPSLRISHIWLGLHFARKAAEDTNMDPRDRAVFMTKLDEAEMWAMRGLHMWTLPVRDLSTSFADELVVKRREWPISPTDPPTTGGFTPASGEDQAMKAGSA